MTVAKFSRFLTRTYEGVRDEDTRAIIRWYKEEEKIATDSGGAAAQPTAPPPTVPSGTVIANSNIDRARPTRPTHATQATQPARPAQPASQRPSPSSAPVIFNSIARATNAPAVQPTSRPSRAVPITTTNTARAANAPTTRPVIQRPLVASVMIANYNGNSRNGLSAQHNPADDDGSLKNARTTTSSNISKGKGHSHTQEPTIISHQDNIMNDGGPVQPPQKQVRQGIPARSSIDKNVSKRENSDSESRNSQAGLTAPIIPHKRHNPPQPATIARQNSNFGSRVQVPLTNEPTKSRHERPGISARRATDNRPKTLNPPHPAATHTQQAGDSFSRPQNSNSRSGIQGSSSNLPAATPSRSQIRSSKQQEAIVFSTPRNSNFGHRNNDPSSSVLATASSVQPAPKSSTPKSSTPAKVNTRPQDQGSRRPTAASDIGLSTVQKIVHESCNNTLTLDTDYRLMKAPRAEHDIVNVHVQQEPRPLTQLQDERGSSDLTPRHNKNSIIPEVLSRLADPNSSDSPTPAVAAASHSQILGSEDGLPRAGPELPRIIQPYIADTSNCTPPRKANKESANIDGTQLVESREVGECIARRSQSPPLHQPEPLDRVSRTPLGRYTPQTAVEPCIGDNSLDTRDQRRQETFPPSRNPSSSGNNPSARPYTSGNEPSEPLERPDPPTGPRHGYQGTPSSRGGYRGFRGYRGDYRECRGGFYTPRGRGYREYRGGPGQRDSGRHSGNFHNGDRYTPRDY